MVTDRSGQRGKEKYTDVKHEPHQNIVDAHRSFSNSRKVRAIAIESRRDCWLSTFSNLVRHTKTFEKQETAAYIYIQQHRNQTIATDVNYFNLSICLDASSSYTIVIHTFDAKNAIEATKETWWYFVPVDGCGVRYVTLLYNSVSQLKCFNTTQYIALFKRVIRSLSSLTTSVHAEHLVCAMMIKPFVAQRTMNRNARNIYLYEMYSHTSSGVTKWRWYFGCHHTFMIWLTSDHCLDAWHEC